uniref:Uncharacterized protein n=1 Tax=Pipistrellus kuhlii TaxID=59472 RepID=A0A7J7V655_PIPKU|nr:hypothetical protein mPipKuh1_008587 [Pipistrellus kuhlii]
MSREMRKNVRRACSGKITRGLENHSKKEGNKVGMFRLVFQKLYSISVSDRFKRLGWGDAFVTVTYLEGIIDVKLFNKGMWDAALSDFFQKTVCQSNMNANLGSISLSLFSSIPSKDLLPNLK